ncbi:MAG TPA: hypothetical protein VK138_07330 [Acidiferrobacterales bacterium]|nr:hypothetical protein [Acidiferrobacterales bacterium]
MKTGLSRREQAQQTSKLADSSISGAQDLAKKRFAMVLNARLILFAGFFVAALIAFFVWAESTLPPGSSPMTLPTDPMMQQAQQNLISMHELMHKIQETQDPAKLRELTQEHMRIMQEQMRMMQEMVQGICGMGPVGQDKGELTRRVSSSMQQIGAITLQPN